MSSGRHDPTLGGLRWCLEGARFGGGGVLLDQLCRHGLLEEKCVIPQIRTDGRRTTCGRLVFF